MRRFFIQFVLPACFCVLPLFAATLVAMCVPREAMEFFWEHVGRMEYLILGLGTLLFLLQMAMCWRALRGAAPASTSAPIAGSPISRKRLSGSRCSG